MLHSADKNFILSDLWSIYKFVPNPQQEEAVNYTNEPLFLTAGPGSGKTRVLLWRTVNLLVFHGVEPEEIFLVRAMHAKAIRDLNFYPNL